MLISNKMELLARLLVKYAYFFVILIFASCKEFEPKSYVYYDDSYSCKITETYVSRGGFFMYSEHLNTWLILPEAIGCSNGRIEKLSDVIIFQEFRLSKDSLSPIVIFETSYLKESIEFNVEKNNGSLWITPNCN